MPWLGRGAVATSGSKDGPIRLPVSLVLLVLSTPLDFASREEKGRELTSAHSCRVRVDTVLISRHAGMWELLLPLVREIHGPGLVVAEALAIRPRYKLYYRVD